MMSQAQDIIFLHFLQQVSYAASLSFLFVSLLKEYG